MAHLRDFLIGIVVLASPSLAAATLTVDLNGGADYTDIQSALDAARDGDEVVVAPGVWLLEAGLVFNRLYDSEDPKKPPINVVLRSEAGAERTELRAAVDSPSMAFLPVLFLHGESRNTRLEGFTITGLGGPRYTNIFFEEGAISCSGSSPTIIDCRIIELRISNGTLA